MSARIGTLARRHGLSRSTLLYYERIGLLRPSARLANGYRQYARADEDRLERIIGYRRTGASLRDISRMLDGGEESLRAVLERRLQELNAEQAGLREQQRVILLLLKVSPLPPLPPRQPGERSGEGGSEQITSRSGTMNLRMWVRLLEASGFDQEARNRWHGAFERSSPESHQRFLEFLCLPAPEIARIRRASRGGALSATPPASRRRRAPPPRSSSRAGRRT